MTPDKALALRLPNKAPRRKRRGIKCALQAAGLQPAYAPRGEELNPVEIKKTTTTGHGQWLFGLTAYFQEHAAKHAPL